MSIDGALGAIGSITTTIGSAANLVKRVGGDSGAAAAGAAPWFSQLRPASFRGVPFGVLGGSGKFGRRQVVHEYPFRDTVWVEDLGRSARHLNVSGFLVGDDAIAKRDRLISAIETAGDGDLMHPTYGQLRVSVMEFSTEERWDQGRVFMVNFNVIESGQRVFPSVATSTGSAVKTAAKAADVASATDFASKVGASLKQGAVTAAQAASTAAAWGRKAQSLANDATNLYNMVGTLTGSVGRYAKSPAIGKFAVVAGAVASAETTIPRLIALGSSARTSVTSAIAKLTAAGSGLGS